MFDFHLYLEIFEHINQPLQYRFMGWAKKRRRYMGEGGAPPLISRYTNITYFYLNSGFSNFPSFQIQFI